MKKIILYLMMGFVFASSHRIYSGQVAVGTNKKNEHEIEKNLLVVDIDKSGVIFIRGKKVRDERLKELLIKIAEIDKSFPIWIHGGQEIQTYRYQKNS